MVISKVLVVGLGSIGRRHLQAIRSLMPHVEIMVLRHRPASENASLADVTTSSLDQVRTFQPEVAVIANPATLHLEIAQRLLSEGCNLLIEKPLAASTRDARLMLNAAKVEGRLCRVGYNLRFMPSLQIFRDNVLKGIIGNVLSVRCEAGQFLGSWRAGSDYRQGVSARREMGGGVLLELSHELDYITWIFGRIDWVSAFVGKQSSLEVDVEDTAHLIAGIKPPQGKALVASLNLDFVRHDTARRCVAIGEKGTLAWDAIRGTVELWLQGGDGWKVLYQRVPDRDQSYRAQWEAFISAVVAQEGSEGSFGATLEEALDVVHVVEAARASSLQQGLRVKLHTRGS